jgi:hypothetical protein
VRGNQIRFNIYSEPVTYRSKAQYYPDRISISTKTARQIQMMMSRFVTGLATAINQIVAGTYITEVSAVSQRCRTNILGSAFPLRSGPTVFPVLQNNALLLQSLVHSRHGSGSATTIWLAPIVAVCVRAGNVCVLCANCRFTLDRRLAGVFNQPRPNREGDRSDNSVE